MRIREARKRLDLFPGPAGIELLRKRGLGKLSLSMSAKNEAFSLNLTRTSWLRSILSSFFFFSQVRVQNSKELFSLASLLDHDIHEESRDHVRIWRCVESAMNNFRIAASFLTPPYLSIYRYSCICNTEFFRSMLADRYNIINFVLMSTQGEGAAQNRRSDWLTR